MKKIAGLLLCGTLLLISFAGSAQNYAESALLYSRLFPQGSARIQGLGGTQVSLGGDYSSAGSNPAGLGMFNKSEFTISPGFNSASSSSQIFSPNSNGSLASIGGPVSASKGTFQIPGISIVMHKKFNNDDNDGRGIISGTFGISISKTNDFNKHMSYMGTNATSSIVDNFVQAATADGTDVTQFDNGNYAYNLPEGLAYNNYLIDSTTNSGAPTTPYYSVLSTYPGQATDIRRQTQREDVTISGGQNQANIAYGINLFDKIFIGGGLGISFLHYQSKRVFSESNYKFDLDPSFNFVNANTLIQNSKTSGTGINGNIGIIGRPVDFIQLGFSYNSPTFYTMTDTYVASLITDYNNFDASYYGYPTTPLTKGTESDGNPILTQSYSLKTPGHINVGATVFILKQGFISADVELVNYPGAKLGAGSSGVNFNDRTLFSDGLSDNDRIKSTSQTTKNYRIGAEYRFGNFRVRGGYNFMPSPYQSTAVPNRAGVDPSIYGYGVSGQVSSISGGLGYRTSKFYIDLAYTYRTGKSGYIPYTSYDYTTGKNNNPTVSSSNTTSLVMVTVGFPFTR